MTTIGLGWLRGDLRLLNPYIAALVTIAALAGCISPAVVNEPSLPRSGGDPGSADGNLQSAHGSAKTVDVEESPPRLEEPRGELTLREVLALVLRESPVLASYSWQIRASEARALQAGLFPNPSFEGEVEDFGGTGPFGGFGLSDSTLALSQLVELGGKRAKRLRVAELGASLSGWDYEAKRLVVLTATAQAFVEALAGQMRVDLLRLSLELSEQVLRSASARVEAGKSSPLEEKRAKVVVSKNRVALERATRALNAARVRLASSWGSSQPRFESVVGELEVIADVPSFEGLAGFVAHNPDVARWIVEISERQARIDLEKAQAVPDVSVSGGVRLLGGAEDTAFVVGLSVPLPIFNRNQGKIREAQLDMVRAEEDRRAAEVRVRAGLAVAYQDLLAGHAEATTLRDEVVPGATDAFLSAQEAFAEGKLGYLDVLDAERTLFEVRVQYVQALSSYHRARAEVEGLLGRPLDAITESKDETQP